MKKRTRYVLVTLAVALAAIQLVPVGRWQTNPPTIREPPWDSPRTRELARGACFDCHSNATVWPVYARIAPASWLVTRDVVEGRSKLNFSAWGTAPSGGKPVDVAEVLKAVREGDMPPGIYTPLHRAARLTAADRQDLLRGLQLSLAGGAAPAPEP